MTLTFTGGGTTGGSGSFWTQFQLLSLAVAVSGGGGGGGGGAPWTTWVRLPAAS